jgi:hypothetical protein
VGPAQAEPISAQWPPAAAAGADVVITYSFSNLLDGRLLALEPWQLRAATEEALTLWSTYAPIHFFETTDSGPMPSDDSYSAAGHPQIRIGHHQMTDLAHAYYPGEDGLARDVHFAESIPWTLNGQWNFLEAVTHELGHSLGLPHVEGELAIMNAFYPQQRFTGLGTAFLFARDIADLRAIYGAGQGSVHALDPVPEPATVVLIASGLAGLAAARRRRNRRFT